MFCDAVVMIASLVYRAVRGLLSLSEPVLRAAIILVMAAVPCRRLTAPPPNIRKSA